MPDIDFWLPTRILFGEGSVDRLNDFVLTFSAQKALVISDPFVGQTSGVARVMAILRAHGIKPYLFTSVDPNPTVGNVNAAWMRLLTQSNHIRRGMPST